MTEYSLQTIYCDANFLDKAIKNRKKSDFYRIAYAIIESIGDIQVDISDEVLRKRIADNPVYNKLYKRENLGIVSMSKNGETLNTVDFTNVSDELFFISGKSRQEIENKREKYGCFVISEDDSDCLISIARQECPILLVPKGIDKQTNSPYRSNPYIKYNDSWEEVFTNNTEGDHRKVILPINSMIISDNFMFSTKFTSRKENSLLAILKAVIPENMDTEFHLSIFTSNALPDKNFIEKTDAINLISEIKEYLGLDKLKIEIVAHGVKELTHDRNIITNYHVVNSGTGFSIIDDKGIREVTKGNIMSVFCNIDTKGIGMLTEKHLHNQMLDWLASIRFSLDNSRTDYYVIGDEFENRLFKKFRTTK